MESSNKNNASVNKLQYHATTPKYCTYIHKYTHQLCAFVFMHVAASACVCVCVITLYTAQFKGNEDKLNEFHN